MIITIALILALVAAIPFIASVATDDYVAADGEIPGVGEDVDYEEVVIPAEVDDDFVVEAGQIANFYGTFNIAAGKTITFEEGSAVCFNFLEDLAITGGTGSGIIIDEGVMVFIEQYEEQGELTPVGVEIGINGSFSYVIDYSNFNEIIRIDIKAGTIIEIGEADFYFESDSFISGKLSGLTKDTINKIIEQISKGEEVEWFALDIDVTFTFESKFGKVILDKDSEAPVTIAPFDNISTVRVALPTKSTSGHPEIYIKDNSALSISSIYAIMDYTQAMDISISFPGITKDTKIAEIIEGEVNLTPGIGGTIEEKLAIKDVAVGEELSIETMTISSKLTLGNTIAASASFIIDEMEAAYDYEDQKGVFTINDFNITTEASFSFNSLIDIFTAENAAKIADYLENYDPENAETYLNDVLFAMIGTYFEGDEYVLEALEKALEEMPEGYAGYVAMVCGYFDEAAKEKKAVLADVYKAEYDKLTTKSFITYSERCKARTYEYGFDLTEYKEPALTYSYNFSIGSIELKNEYGVATVNGIYANYSFESTKLTIVSEMGYENLEAVYAEYDGLSYKIGVPGAKISASLKEATFTFKAAIEGDIVAQRNEETPALDVKGLEISLTVSAGINGLDIKAVVSADEFYLFVEDEGLTVSGKNISATEEFLFAVPTLTLQDIVKIVEAYLIVETGDPVLVAEEDEDMSIYDIIEMVKEYVDKIAEIIDKDPKDFKVIDEIKVNVESLTMDNENGSAKLKNVDLSFKIGYENDAPCVELKAKADEAAANTIGQSANAIKVTGLDVFGTLGENNVINVTIKGNGSYTVYAQGQEYATIAAKNVSIKAEIYEDGDVEVGDISGTISLKNNGIELSTSTIKFDEDKMTLIFEKLDVSGNYTGLPDYYGNVSPLKSVNGTAKNLIIYLGENFMPEESTIDEVDLTYLNNDDSKLNMKIVRDKEEYTVTFDVTGVFYEDEIANVPMLRILLVSIPDDQVVDITGEGMFVMDNYDEEVDNYHGTFYVLENCFYADIDLDIDFKGAALEVTNTASTGIVLGIKALPGFELNPESYLGFTVSDIGVLTLDPEIVEAGSGTIYEVSTGEKFTLTIDGTAQEVRYGDEVTKNVAGIKAALWIEDDNGIVYGNIVDGTWHYYYAVLGDLSLKTVQGKVVVPVKDEVVNVDADAFTFETPSAEEMPFVEFTNASGIIMKIENDGEGSQYKVSAVKTTYNGHDAYMLEANTGMYVTIPVSSDDAVLYHVVNGQAVPVSGVISDTASGKVLTAYVGSYSTYYVDENNDNGGSSNNTMIFIIIGVVAVLVIAGVVIKVAKK